MEISRNTSSIEFISSTTFRQYGNRFHKNKIWPNEIFIFFFKTNNRLQLVKTKFKY